MISFLKLLAVRLLRVSGRPELVAMADWIDDAPRAAVETIVRLLGQSLNFGGEISAETSDKILKTKAAYSEPQTAVISRQADTRSPFLHEYLGMLKTVAELGCGREILLLRGFIHCADCASLWQFDKKVNIEVTNAGHEPAIEFKDSGLKITLLPAISADELRVLNFKIGENPSHLPPPLAPMDAATVISVREHVLIIEKIEITKQRRLTGNMRLPKWEEYEFRKLVSETIEIDTTFAGVRCLAESIPIALQERGAALELLRQAASVQQKNSLPAELENKKGKA